MKRFILCCLLVMCVASPSIVFSTTNDHGPCITCPPGPEGPEGPRGINGKDGIDGKDGKDGKDGNTGVLHYEGLDGKDGKDGVNGLDGKDGKKCKGDPGVAGKDGTNGVDGEDARTSGTAGALAVASLEQPRPGHSVFGIGYGNYRDANAIAIGGGHAFNNDISIDIGGFISKDNDYDSELGINASVNFHF